jgi:D-arabinose 1-dehydrogenase-like Zn-dependent alcohol dehydrogenase
MDLESLLLAIFGVGGVGMITVMVTSYRRLKVGKINDEESLIKRLYRELGRKEKENEDLVVDRDKNYKMMQHWREQAWQYRLQLIEGNIEPNDMEVPE